MLWDLIRDFIVQHITGGYNSVGQEFQVFGGATKYYEGGNMELDSVSLNGILYQINDSPDGLPYYLGLSDWLATTLTAISIIFILVACVMFVVKIIKLVGNLVK